MLFLLEILTCFFTRFSLWPKISFGHWSPDVLTSDVFLASTPKHGVFHNLPTAPGPPVFTKARPFGSWEVSLRQGGVFQDGESRDCSTFLFSVVQSFPHGGATTPALFPFALWPFALVPFALSHHLVYIFHLLYMPSALYVVCSMTKHIICSIT